MRLYFKAFFISVISLTLVFGNTLTTTAQGTSDLLLKNFRPVSIYNIPTTKITKAAFPVIDFHAHDYPKNDAEVDAWVKTMDKAGIAKSMILSYSTGAAFDEIVKKYARYSDRFDVWCGFDYTGADQPNWSEKAVAELGRCYKMGAKGVGELGDKGLGELYSKPTPGYGIHIDDPRMKPLLATCAELGLPVSIHVSEDEWMYQKPDSTNDGLLNAAKWNVDMNVAGKFTHDQLVGTLENAARDNPGTTFIACHLANCNSDFTKLARLFDAHPNLYADVAARYAEFAPIPRAAKAFMEKYSGRIVYGTDMGSDSDMYQTTFRILESADEHFYDHDRFSYHWPLHGLNLSKSTLKRIYSTNARKIMKK
jgi:predicted TIM-barrel fold metal-dependent hydrolase